MASGRIGAFAGLVTGPRHAPARAPRDGRIAVIQLLRAVAAGTVALSHLAFAFADYLGAGLGVTPSDWASQAAVMLFFVISGYVMVISTGGEFGRAGARRRFWLRRTIRIIPPYWLATGLLVLVYLTIMPQPVDPAALARSLVLLPFFNAAADFRPVPILWVGWTLFFEMVFYLVFGAFLSLARDRALAATSVTLVALVLAGHFMPSDIAPLVALTRPVMLVFIAGMALAAWRTRGGELRPVLRGLAAAGALASALLVPLPGQGESLGFDYLASYALPAVLFALACLGGPLALPRWRWIDAGGEMSYALYLLHVPLAWIWLWFWPRLPFFDAGPWDYLVTAVVVSLAASWLFFVWIERPMTLALNRRLRSPHGQQRSA